ncbi:hypothetical protein EYF80_057172 [Liparis tanakae]|uniref:Uncharacterized protein n=1 Tax=Liparis tanakae TaxID=230148 RepID=A0A4Z2EUR5_9TELE|nr:hypothetical protein EYF80_057172 [Liparis tanakae]
MAMTVIAPFVLQGKHFFSWRDGAPPGHGEQTTDNRMNREVTHTRKLHNRLLLLWCRSVTRSHN